MISVAILIDGGYFLKRLRVVRPDVDVTDPEDVARSIRQLVHRHLEQLNEVWRAPDAYQLLFRTFYYDARPYGRKAHKPVSGAAIDFAKTDQARFRERLFDALRSSRNVALRLGGGPQGSRPILGAESGCAERPFEWASRCGRFDRWRLRSRHPSERRGHADRVGHRVAYAQTSGGHHRARVRRFGLRVGGEAGAPGGCAVRARSALAYYPARSQRTHRRADERGSPGQADIVRVQVMWDSMG